ncbi:MULTISPECIES: hypothetical protein [Marivita]|uniref:Uncharacterized protein n=1 Tax=Marivita cryptomonadis TaxID=505252 RepID=A0A9Q2PCA3_9RHOB|nr:MULTISPECIES: hypothetical protein [Marivita]MCR9169508.1 hypothetical protein [Paracoccaceae bacterium]MBM2322229.1 hypothetical protein [Marivita cryptomonadis]MBM2331810.1 hypothetical protein [Marivita cryptomonadis]MBM2341395.1 hypothetical protein [Marivita cryptomonadis]MBM2346058.1 hypothetical protein [Marivita cryptomonadis]
MKFRRIPQEIEAFQLTRAARLDNSNWPAWLHEAWQKEHGEVGALWPGNWPHSDGTDELLLQEGPLTTVVAFGNWILNIDGELSVMHNRVFVKLYEHVMPADDDDVSGELLAEMRAWIDVTVMLRHVLADSDPELADAICAKCHDEACDLFGDAYVELLGETYLEIVLGIRANEAREANALAQEQRQARQARVDHFREFFVRNPHLIRVHYLFGETGVATYTNENGFMRGINLLDIPDASDAGVLEYWAEEAADGRIPDPTIGREGSE